MTQEERIMEYMQKHGGITQFDANRDLGISRLAARISDIQRHGTPVYRKSEKVMNRYGEITHVTRYSLEADEVEA